MEWAVIPAYNEGLRIGKVIRKAKRFTRHVIVVDDGSRDSTSTVAERAGALVLRHIVNLGKGAAVKTGCDYAFSQGATKIVVLDSDGQHAPEDIPLFERKLRTYDIVFGQRTFDENMPFIFKIGNNFLDWMVSVLFRIELRDTQCGYRAFSAIAYRKIRWRASDYSMETEMIANAGRHHLRYATVPIATIYTDRYKGTTVLDGVRIALNMMFWRLRHG